MYTIRDATIQDAQRILTIYDYYVRHTAVSFEYETPSLVEFRERMLRTMQRYPYLVAVQNDMVMGYAYAGPFKERAAYDWCCELSVYVSRDARKCGIGRMLYTAMEQALRNMGVCNLYACIAYPEAENVYLSRDSARFHERMGFRTVAMFRDCGYKFDHWYHMIWMEKIIGEHKCGQTPVRPYHEDVLPAGRLAHTAIYVRDLEAARRFFQHYLHGISGELYRNPMTRFSSYFLRFYDGSQLELMSRPALADGGELPQAGYAHAAFALGSRDRVDALTARLAADGYTVASGPRVTGDGFYESCVAGPGGILIELTV